jgi:hypothetical protein
LNDERRHTQSEVEEVIIDVLASGSRLTTAEITRATKLRLALVGRDRDRAAKRPNESKVDQIIANALQARRRLCRDSLIERVEKGLFRITAKGVKYYEERQADLDAMRADFDQMLRILN